jgi:hypothetical protein
VHEQLVSDFYKKANFVRPAQKPGQNVPNLSDYVNLKHFLLDDFI